MKATILSFLIIFAIVFLLRNVLGFLKIMFSAKRPSFRTDRILERAKGILIYVFGQKRILKTIHGLELSTLCFFGGFVIITVGSLELLILGFVPGFEIFGFFRGQRAGSFSTNIRRCSVFSNCCTCYGCS